MTLHGAKGLEFDIVFLPAGRKKFSLRVCRFQKTAPKGLGRNAGLPMSA